MSKLIEAAAEFLSRDTSSKPFVSEAQVPDHVKKASDILKKSYKGKDNNFHKHTRDGKITVDYSTDKDTAMKHAQSHVETLKKHGIDSEARVTRSERQGTPYWYHGVKLKSTTTK